MNLTQPLESVSEATLDRLIRAGLVAVVIGIALVGAVYYLDRHPLTGPSLVERQTAAAEDAVRKHPNNLGLRLQLANVYRDAKQPGNAVEQYEAILKIDPGQRTAMLGKGEVLAGQGKLPQAARSFRDVISKSGGGEFAAVDPQLESAYYGLGSVALELGQPRDAIKALRRAVSIEATDADAWNLLGTAALNDGSPKLAVAALRRAVLLVPTGWCQPYKRLSDAYRTLKSRARAEYAGAMVDLCEKRPADAASRLRPLTSGPGRVDVLVGLGMVAESQSERAGAIRWYRKALTADKSNFAARTALGRLGVGTAHQSGQSSLPAGHPSGGGGQPQ